MFELHPTLAADTVEVARWPLCRVLLMNDANYPWLILVPQRESVTEVHQLAPADRAMLIEEITLASERLAATTGAHKMNVGALGNVVPQLHVHVIARFSSDAAWPRPIWGAVPRTLYTKQALAATEAKLRKLLQQ